MKPIPKSGLYYPNNISRGILTALEETVGKQGLHDLLNHACLPAYIDEFPPDNQLRECDFRDISLINASIDDIYGPIGGRNLAIKVGRIVSEEKLSKYGMLGGIGGIVLKVIPKSSKLKRGLNSIAQVFSTMSDQYTDIEEEGDQFFYRIHKCPVCWGRSLDQPRCFMAIGMVQGGLHLLSVGRDITIRQTSCSAAGSELCEFIIGKESTI